MSNKAEKNKKWREAKKKFRLSNMHIQRARELGMNPKKLAGLANHKQEPWKAPLPVFIEVKPLYLCLLRNYISKGLRKKNQILLIH